MIAKDIMPTMQHLVDGGDEDIWLCCAQILQHLSYHSDSQEADTLIILNGVFTVIQAILQVGSGWHSIYHSHHNHSSHPLSSHLLCPTPPISSHPNKSSLPPLEHSPAACQAAGHALLHDSGYEQSRYHSLPSTNRIARLFNTDYLPTTHLFKSPTCHTPFDSPLNIHQPPPNPSTPFLTSCSTTSHTHRHQHPYPSSSCF